MGSNRGCRLAPAVEKAPAEGMTPVAGIGPRRPDGGHAAWGGGPLLAVATAAAAAVRRGPSGMVAVAARGRRQGRGGRRGGWSGWSFPGGWSPARFTWCATPPAHLGRGGERVRLEAKGDREGVGGRQGRLTGKPAAEILAERHQRPVVFLVQRVSR